MTNKQTAEDIANQSLDAFYAKDMKGWSELCDPNVIVEFPFAPEGSVSKFEGRAAIHDYLKNYPNMIDIHLTYDLTASLLAPQGNARASAVAAQLDEKVLVLLTAAVE
jgi:ketosteroid isomerase-like protein